MAFRNVSRAGGATGKALAASLVAWSFLFMMNVAMRTVAPSLLVGLTFARLLTDGDALGAPDRRRGLWTYATIDSAPDGAARAAAAAAGRGANVRSFFGRSSNNG
jgi:hypothetical protein